MSLGILTIATNRYYDYWVGMVRSFHTSIPNSSQHTFHIFTDQVAKARLFSKENPQLNIKVHEIENMRFPEATLLRYEIYERFKHHLVSEVLMHLDADMLVGNKKFLELEDFTKLSRTGIALVSHPGYWRPEGSDLKKLLFQNPQIAIRDALKKIMLGGLGAWETRKGSGAFVPRKQRKHYVCGGIWAGENHEFKKLCAELSNKTQLDLASNHIPIWHDESYLNYWAAYHQFKLLDPSFCFDPRYPQLAGLENIVEAVNKNA